MSDSFAAPPAESAPPQPESPADPLAGDWSEGLPGPARALGIPEPKLLSLDATPPSGVPAIPAAEPPPVEIAVPGQPPAVAAEVPATDAPQEWSSAEPSVAEESVFESPALAVEAARSPSAEEPVFESPSLSVEAERTEAADDSVFESPALAVERDRSPREESVAPSPLPLDTEPSLPSVIIDDIGDVTPAFASPAPLPALDAPASDVAPSSSAPTEEEPSPPQPALVSEAPPVLSTEPAPVPVTKPPLQPVAEPPPAPIAMAPEAPLPSPAPALPPLPSLADLPELPAAPGPLPTVIVDDAPAPAAGAEWPAPAQAAPVEPAAPAEPPDAPTPWSDPVPEAAPASQEAIWSTPAPAEPEAVWGAPPDAAAPAAPSGASASGWAMTSPANTDSPAPAEELVWSVPAESASAPAQDWEAPAADETAELPKAPEPVVAAGPDSAWGTMGDSPDWSAPAAAAPQADAWTAAPPASDGDWAPAAAPAPVEEWSAPPPPAATNEDVWDAPPPSASAARKPVLKPVPAWNAPAVGASALEQLDGGTLEAEPGAATQLFGSVSGPLTGDNDDLGPPQELDSPEQFLRPVEPEELASPEQFLKPIDHADPDLPVPVETPAPPPKMALAQMRPKSFGALEVQGEHRVAVHLRGGGTRRGTLRDVDLAKSSFSLLPQGGGEAEPLYHAEVKAIFFMLAPGEKPKPPDGKKVVVTFADGRTIEGHRDGAEARHGFFLVPSDAARTNTWRIYIAREATSDIKDG